VDKLERLEAIEEIKRLKAKYFRTLDGKEWDGFESCLTDDIFFDFRDSQPEKIADLAGGAALVEGAAAATKWAEQTIHGGTSCHQGHMPEIEITSDTTAEGIWAMSDRLWWPIEEKENLPYKELDAVGHYYESYRKVDGTWLIEKLRLTRLHIRRETW